MALCPPVVKISISDTFVVHHSNLLAIAVRISDDWIQQPVMVANMTYLTTFAIMRGIGKTIRQFDRESICEILNLEHFGYIC